MKISKLSKFYVKAKSEEMIKNRYRNCIPAIRLTLERIVPSKEFQNLKGLLRLKGWKDWHILLAIDNLTKSYRMKKLGINTIEKSKIYSKKFLEEEQDNAIRVPLSEFTEENMTEALQGSMLPTLKLLGFSFPERPIKIQKIESFLRNKFNYFEDDVAHDNILDI